ncbi:MAG: hypothetical protein U0670_20565 [Anaerolineae bacterium]
MSAVTQRKEQEAVITADRSSLAIPATIIGIAITLLFITGIVHFIDAPDSLSELPYKGWMFIANGIGALIAAYGVFRQKSWGWYLGLLIAGGALVGYVISRTVGLPGAEGPDEWLEPLGILSLIVEGGFVIFFLSQVRALFKPNAA